MTPAVGSPEGPAARRASGFSFLSRVSHHASVPPARVPPSIDARKRRFFVSVTFSKTSGLPSAAPASAPRAAPVSIRITRDGETSTTVASAPAPTTPIAAP